MQRFFVFLTLFLPLFLHGEPNAFCTVPVADLVGVSMAQAAKQNLPVKSDQEQPFSDQAGDYACTRLSQLLFNEQVEILETNEKEARIKVFHWYYTSGTPLKKQVTYWVDKTALTRLDTLDKQTQKKVPVPISFEQKTIPQAHIVTLKQPFCKKNRYCFSAGTRFVKAPKQTNKNSIQVFAYSRSKQDFEIITLPKNICVDQAPTNPYNKRMLFIEILKTWANDLGGYIPYVFGGASVGLPYKNNVFTGKKVPTPNKTATFFERSSLTPNSVKVGIDCAHTIARAAHIAGIPYFVKNTSTIKRELKPLTKYDTIEPGDILVWQGHTVVISDPHNNLLIEARGYDHGYGIVQEVPFAEQFKGIRNTAQLRAAYLTKTPIKRLNKAGKIIQTIYDFMIMKLPV